MKINTAVGSRKINRDAKLNLNQDVFIVHIFLLFLGAKDLPNKSNAIVMCVLSVKAVL